MGQKVNPNIFNLVEKKNKTSKYSEKKLIEKSVFSRTDLEIKKFTLFFFKSHKIIINDWKIVYLTNSLYIFMSCYQKIEDIFFKKKKQPKFKLLTIIFVKKR